MVSQGTSHHSPPSSWTAPVLPSICPPPIQEEALVCSPGSAWTIALSDPDTRGHRGLTHCPRLEGHPTSPVSDPSGGLLSPWMPSYPPAAAVRCLNTSGEVLCSWPLCWGSPSAAPRNRSPSPKLKQQPKPVPPLPVEEHPGPALGAEDVWGIQPGSISALMGLTS